MEFIGPNGEKLRLAKGYRQSFFDENGVLRTFTIDQVTPVNSVQVSNDDLTLQYIRDLRKMAGLSE